MVTILFKKMRTGSRIPVTMMKYAIKNLLKIGRAELDLGSIRTISEIGSGPYDQRSQSSSHHPKPRIPRALSL